MTTTIALDVAGTITPITTHTSDPAHDILRAEPHPLHTFFYPATIGVIGASERQGALGRRVIENFTGEAFAGKVFPVSATHSTVLGIPAFKSILDVPVVVDLAVIITPARTVPNIVLDCVTKGVKSAVIISSGFREHGEVGHALEQEIKKRIEGTGLRIIGPNCLGVMNPFTGLNATFAKQIAYPGSVAFISQSGALCTSILDWSLREMVGFSAFISVGSMLDVDWGDLIDYLGNDPTTQSLVIYMESIGDARAFLSAAREVSRNKPIIVIKTGRTEAAAKAAASHTGTMTGSDEVLDAAFKRAGVLRVDTVSDLFYMADVLAKQPRPKGSRLAIVTNAGGPGVLAADALMAGGGELATISPITRAKLDSLLPPHWSHSNPIDLLGDATTETFETALQLMVEDPNVDGVLAITAPQGLADPTQIAERVAKYAKSPKPVIASFMGGAEIATSDLILNRNGIPTFPFPDEAARAFNYMWKYSANLKSLYETPVRSFESEPDRILASQSLLKARLAGRTILTEWESKTLLTAYGIPVVDTRIATTAEEAWLRAEEFGYPVVLKLHSETITHKSDVGGVQLNLKDESAVQRAFALIEKSVTEHAGSGHFQGVTVQPMITRSGYELILGSSIDSQFGPVLLFGAGGEFVEVFKDRALGLPPLTTTLARHMMEETYVLKALKGVRGRAPIDLAALESLLVRFSHLVIEQRWIKEIDINPLLACPEGLIALDARVILHSQAVTEKELPVSAIRAYPTKYVNDWNLKDGEEVTIRPIRPEDEPALLRFHSHLSERSVFLRYFEPLKLSERIAHERLARICFIDYDREMVLIAERKSNSGEIIAVARLTSTHIPHEAECAILIGDEYQNLGLGTEILRRILEIARTEGVERVHSTILEQNAEMLAVVRKLGFTIEGESGNGRLRVVYQ